MPHYIKTGYWALEKNGYKGWLKLEDIISGGGGGVIEVDYTTLQSLISSNQLSPGATYKITGFNKNMPSGGPENPNGYLPEVLYDDGTNSGITIYLQAITTNTLSESGHGEFYNPIYGDQTTYNNTDGTGLYGIWDGDNPDPLQVPAYQVDQVVFWGGYAWKNLTGNVGVADDTLNLDPTDWEKLPYSNTTYYEKVIDEIKVDLNNGILIGRTNVENQITVEFNADQYSWWMGFDYNPVSVMGWGLYSKITPEQLDNEFYGISNVSVINSVCETVNFKGNEFLNVKMNSSYLFDNYFGKDSEFNYNTFMHNSSVNDNTLTNNSAITYNTLTDGYIEFNTLTNNGYIGTNTLTHGSYIDVNDISTGSRITDNRLIKGNIQFNILLTDSRIDNNTLAESNINDNTLTESTIDINTLSQNSFINENTLIQSNINNNTLTSSSTIRQNTLTSNSGIQFNTLTISYINVNVLTDSTIEVNTLTNTSSIGFMTLTNNTTILFNTLISSTFESITLTNKTLGNINITKTGLNDNLSTATDIFLNTEKKIFTRLDGTKRLLYYNTSDTPTIVNVNA